jgi:hypothetical protein
MKIKKLTGEGWDLYIVTDGVMVGILSILSILSISRSLEVVAILGDLI